MGVASFYGIQFRSAYCLVIITHKHYHGGSHRIHSVLLVLFDMSFLTQIGRCLPLASSITPRSTRMSLSQNIVFCRFAHNQSGGKTSNGRDSNPKYLGVKKYGGCVAFICC